MDVITSLYKKGKEKKMKENSEVHHQHHNNSPKLLDF